MNWFARYGIPGAYFYGIIFAWIYIFYSCDFRLLLREFKNFEALIFLAGATFLPIGYILTIFATFLYFLCPFLGVHKAAKEYTPKSKHSNKERILEADSVLEAKNFAGEKNNDYKLARDWMAKRVDVIAISFAIIIATVLSVVIGYFLPTIFELNRQIDKDMGLVLGVISLVIIGVMVGIMFIFRSQVIHILADIFYSKKPEGNIEGDKVE